MSDVVNTQSMNLTPLEHAQVLSVASRLGKTPAQVLIRWSLQKGNVVIPKSVTASRILENSQVFDFELTAADVEALNQLPQQRLLNPDFKAGNEPVFPYF